MVAFSKSRLFLLVALFLATWGACHLAIQGGAEWSGIPVQEVTVSSPDISPTNKLIIDYLCTPHIALLPLIGYGGGEASCEAEIEGLSKLYDLGCVEFVAVVPGRDTHGRNYSFPIMESGNVGDSGESFIAGYVEQLHQRDKAQWPHIIWCQSPWCPPTLQQLGIEIPVIVTLHYGDCGECQDLGARVRWRMPSANSLRTTTARNAWMADRGFVVWEGFADEEYQFSPTEGDYFLWVGGCGWFRDKGLSEFQDLARDHSDKKFVVYCSGDPTNLPQFAAEHPNFEFRGELLRGQTHHDAFAKAKAFFFWTHIPHETFGRVVVEALSKGTPVIGSTCAANQELIVQGEGGITTEDMAVVKEALDHHFDRNAAYKSAQRFRSKVIVRQLLEETRRLLASLRQQEMIMTDVELFPVLDFTGVGTSTANQCWRQVV